MLIRFPVVSLVVTIAVSASPVLAQPTLRTTFPEAESGAGKLVYIDQIPVLFVEGTPRDIGRQSGVLLSSSLQTVLQAPREMLRRQGLQVAWPLVTWTGRALSRNAPQAYQEELAAVVAAAQLDEQAHDVLKIANSMVELRRLGGCSTLIIDREKSATDGPLFGRNLDLDPMGLLDRIGLVTVVHPADRHAFVAIGFPGLFGVLSGMNEKGLAVATLDVYHSGDDAPIFNAEGIPLAYTFRRILEECETVAQAEAVLRQTPRTTYMNLAVCDPQRGVVFELTPKSVAVRRPQQGIVACTNHFRSPGLTIGETCTRFENLRRARDDSKIGLADLQKYLHSANQGTSTIQSMVFEPAGRTLHLALGTGPVSDHRLTRLTWDRLEARRRQ